MLKLIKFIVLLNKLKILVNFLQLMKKFLGIPLISMTAFMTGYSPNPSQNLFDSKTKKDDNEIHKEKQQECTKTYIWGNGIFQPRPDATLRFLNFEPKLIKNFLGDKNPNFKQVTFGEYHEGGIDINGNLYIWKKHILDASLSADEDHTRKDLIKLDDGSNLAYLTFSKGYIWGLKENGDVYQWKIDVEYDEDKNINSVEVNPKARKVDILKDISQISCGEDHFVALDKNGEVWMMGDDTLGIL